MFGSAVTHAAALLTVVLMIATVSLVPVVQGCTTEVTSALMADVAAAVTVSTFPAPNVVCLNHTGPYTGCAAAAGASNPSSAVVIVGNGATLDCSGPALTSPMFIVQGHSLSLRSVRVVGLASTGVQGGLIRVDSGGPLVHVSIADAFLESISSTLSGAVLAVRSSVAQLDYSLTDVTAAGLSCSMGGGGLVYVSSSAGAAVNGTLARVVVTDVSVADEGGVLRVSAGVLSVFDSSMTRCSAVGDGGCVRVYNTSAAFEDVVLADGSTGDDGGLLRIAFKANDQTVTLTRVSLSGGRSVQDGGCVDVTSDGLPGMSSTLLALTDVSLTNCTGLDGGGLDISTGSASAVPDNLVVSATRLTVLDCHADDDSGAINLSKVQLSIDDSLIANCSCRTGEGSAMRLHELAGPASISNTLITGNTVLGLRQSAAVHALAGVTVAFTSSAVCDNAAAFCLPNIYNLGATVTGIPNAYPSGTTNCHNGVSGCALGNGNAVCTSCNRGWTGVQCDVLANCVSPASNCGGSTVGCSECAPRFGIDQELGTCIDCDPEPGLYFVGTTMACGSCAPSCLDCDGSPTACTACAPPLQLVGSTCVAPPPPPPPPPSLLPPPPPPPLATPTDDPFEPAYDGVLQNDHPATSSASFALYIVLLSVALGLLLGIRRRVTEPAKYAADPEHWLGLGVGAMVSWSHSLMGISMAATFGSSFSVAGRAMALALTANVFLFVTSLMPILRPSGFAKSEDTLSLDRVADACFTTVVSTLVSALFGVPLIRRLLTDPRRSSTAGYALGAAINTVLLILNSVIIVMSAALEGFELNAGALSATYAISFAMGLLVVEPLVIVFQYHVLGVRAILVAQGGNGGVNGGSAVAPVAATTATSTKLDQLDSSGSLSNSLSTSIASSDSSAASLA